MNLRDALNKGWHVLLARWYLRPCDHVGRTARVWGRPIVHNGGYMAFGERVRLFATTVRSEFVTYPGGRLEVGDRVFINYGASIAARQLVRIGAGCSIGTYAIIMDNDYHQVGDLDTLPESRPIVLEERVWLGARVIVLRGVTIGHDAVIGAGSVVTRDIPPRCVAAGVPARVIREH